jgi:hypothetical protein
MTFANTSVMIARYSPRSRRAIIPITSAAGTTSSAASGAAPQKGVSSPVTSRPDTYAPSPTKLAGISESCPTNPVSTTTESPISE